MWVGGETNADEWPGRQDLRIPDLQDCGAPVAGGCCDDDDGAVAAGSRRQLGCSGRRIGGLMMRVCMVGMLGGHGGGVDGPYREQSRHLRALPGALRPSPGLESAQSALATPAELHLESVDIDGDTTLGAAGFLPGVLVAFV